MSEICVSLEIVGRGQKNRMLLEVEKILGGLFIVSASGKPLRPLLNDQKWPVWTVILT